MAERRTVAPDVVGSTPTSRPNDATFYLALGSVKGQLSPKCHAHDFSLYSLMVSSSARLYPFIVVRISE